MTDMDGIGPHLRFMNINKINIPSVNKPPPYGRTSRAWDSLLVMKSGCAGGRGFVPRLGQ